MILGVTLTAGCGGVSLTSGPDGTPGDAAPYAGEWTSSNSTINIDDLQGGSAHVTLTHEGQAVFDDTVQLLDVYGTQIVVASYPSSSSSPASYGIVRVRLDGDNLELWPLDEAQVRSDVGQSLITGTIVNHVEDFELARVDATPQELSVYIKQHPDLFGSSPEAIYARTGGGTSGVSMPVALSVAGGLLLAMTALAFVLSRRRT